MVYIVMAYVVTAYRVMAHRVMAHIVMADLDALQHQRAADERVALELDVGVERSVGADRHEVKLRGEKRADVHVAADLGAKRAITI